MAVERGGGGSASGALRLRVMGMADGCCEARRCWTQEGWRERRQGEVIAMVDGDGYGYGYVATDVNEDGGGCKGDIHRCVRARSALSVGSEIGREPGPQANKQQEPTVSHP